MENDILPGNKIGRLTIIKYEHRKNTQNKNIVWYFCKCDCGNDKWIQRGGFISGSTKSCGCIQREIASNNVPWNKIGSIETTKRALLNSYKSGAKKRDLCWKIEENFFFDLVEGSCHYCGIMFSNVRKGIFGDYSYNGIDRKNNTLGYSNDNVVSCCEDCNRTKGDRFTYEEFMLLSPILTKIQKDRLI